RDFSQIQVDCRTHRQYQPAFIVSFTFALLTTTIRRQFALSFNPRQNRPSHSPSSLGAILNSTTPPSLAVISVFV
ncbi:Hypothetical predicted protein, partial [Olea europaea subsp. europaea]